MSDRKWSVAQLVEQLPVKETAARISQVRVLADQQLGFVAPTLLSRGGFGNKKSITATPGDFDNLEANRQDHLMRIEARVSKNEAQLRIGTAEGRKKKLGGSGIIRKGGFGGKPQVFTWPKNRGKEKQPLPSVKSGPRLDEGCLPCQVRSTVSPYG